MCSHLNKAARLLIIASAPGTLQRLSCKNRGHILISWWSQTQEADPHQSAPTKFFWEQPNVFHTRPVLSSGQTLDKKRNLQTNHPWPGWIWRTCQASSHWSSHWLSSPGLVETARDNPLWWASLNSTLFDKSSNGPLYRGADGSAHREAQVCCVTTYYVCLLLRDGMGGERAEGFHLFQRQACKLQSGVRSNSHSCWAV